MDGSLQEELLGGNDAAVSKPGGETTWVKIALIIVTNFLGAGVLSLPFSASSLGYLAYGVALVSIFAVSLLSGRAFSACFRARPESRMMSDVAREAFGPRGERLVRYVQYFYMCGVLVIFHLTCAIALRRAAGGGCAVLMSAIVGACALVAMQARSTSTLGTLSALGTGCILVYIGIILVLLPVRGRRPGAREDVLPPPSSSLVAAGVAVMDVVFAFSGQVVYVELQAEMRTPAHFMRSVLSSNGLMFCTYAAIACLGYHFVGAEILASGEPITSAVAATGSPVDRVVNAFLFVQVMVAYTIEGNIVARGFYLMAGRDAKTVARSAWTAATGGLVAAAFVVSNLVPFFSDVMGLMSGLCAGLLCYTFPFAAALVLVDDLGAAERALYRALVGATALLAVLGSTASILDIAKHFDSSGTPFSC